MILEGLMRFIRARSEFSFRSYEARSADDVNWIEYCSLQVIVPETRMYLSAFNEDDPVKVAVDTRLNPSFSRINEISEFFLFLKVVWKV